MHCDQAARHLNGINDQRAHVTFASAQLSNPNNIQKITACCSERYGGAAAVVGAVEEEQFTVELIKK